VYTSKNGNSDIASIREQGCRGAGQQIFVARMVLRLIFLITPRMLILQCSGKSAKLLSLVNWFSGNKMSDFKAKMHQIQFPLGLCPRSHWRSLQHSQIGLLIPEK